MAPTPEPQPDHPFVGPLDDIFKKNAAALAGWLTYLNHPEEHTGPRLVEYGDGTVLEAQDDRIAGTGNVVGTRSLLRDMEPFWFFAHADVLSGQRVGELDSDGNLARGDVIADTFQLIEEVRNKKPKSMTSPRADSADVWSDIHTYVDPTFASERWSGLTADKAQCRYAQMVKWYENHRNPALQAMSMFLVKYSAIVLKARQDINEIMGKLVKFFEEWTKNDMSVVDIADFMLTFLKGILGLTPKLVNEMFLVYDVTKQAAELAKKSDHPTELGYDGDASNGVYRLLDSYIRVGNDVLKEASGAIHELVTDPDHGVMAVRNNWVGVPDWTKECVP